MKSLILIFIMCSALQGMDKETIEVKIITNEADVENTLKEVRPTQYDAQHYDAEIFKVLRINTDSIGMLTGEVKRQKGSLATTRACAVSSLLAVCSSSVLLLTHILSTQ